MFEMVGKDLVNFTMLGLLVNESDAPINHYANGDNRENEGTIFSDKFYELTVAYKKLKELAQAQKAMP